MTAVIINGTFNFMKTLRNRLVGRRAPSSGRAAIATMLLLAALPVIAADTPYAATGWVNAVLAPGITCINTHGQVFVRGNVHTARVQSSDPRFTGSRLIFVNGRYQADGTANLQGTVYHEVGTWDADGTHFTASGGLWELSFRGVMQTDNSLQLHLIGSGSGGNIDGLRVEETLTRAAASGTLDPTVPYLYTGTIKPAPENTSVVLDNFNDDRLTGWDLVGSGHAVETFHVGNDGLIWSRGSGYAVLDSPLGKIGLMICAELWSDGNFAGPVLARQGAELLVSSSAWWNSVADSWDAVTKENAVRAKRWHVASQHIGAVGHAQCYGHSQVVDPLGRIVCDTGAAEGLVMWATDILIDVRIP